MNQNVKRIKVYDLDMVLLGKTKIVSPLPEDNMDVFCMAVKQVESWAKKNHVDIDNVFWDFM
jgi:hypothetical protein